MSYVAYHEGDWSMIKEAEYSLEMVKEDYVIDGTIDLLEDRDGKLNIIDFKQERNRKKEAPSLEDTWTSSRSMLTLWKRN